MGRVKDDVTHYKDDTAFPAFEIYKNRSPSDWFVIDSAATRHMTDNKEMLRNFKPVKLGDWKVTGIKNTILDVHGQGDVHVTTQVITSNPVANLFVLS